MKSAIFEGAGLPLAIRTVPDPIPAPNQVVIKVGNCGICGSDLKMTEAGSPLLCPAGTKLGHEYAGEIAAIGRDVRAFRLGDRVTAMPITGCGSCPACLAGEPLNCVDCRYIMGGFSEYTVADARYVFRLPGDLSLSDGALVEPMACGSQAVRLSQLGPRSRVLVIGAGAVGLTVMYWARRAGCAAVVATALTNRHAKYALAMGASNLIPQENAKGDEIVEALGGKPDVIFECSGASGQISRAIDTIGQKGTIVATGFCFDRESFIPGNAMMKQLRVLFSLGYNLHDFRQSIEALDAGFVEPRAMLSDTIGLKDLPAMLEIAAL